MTEESDEAPPETVPKVGQEPPAAACRDACLVNIYPIGPGMGKRYVLSQAPVVLGRDDACDICVDDATVSRRHARVQRQADGYWVVDLDSTNGTLVNDEVVTRKQLQDGDYLHVGNAIFRFLAGGNVEIAYHEEIHRLVIIDALTGIYNKRFLLDFLDHELVRVNRYHRPLSLILFDIDHFKKINETLGHLGGDYVLRELSACVGQVLRRETVFARYGGEEFGVALPETTLPQALRVAERIRERVEKHPFRYQGNDQPVTVSLGVAHAEGDEAFTSAGLIGQADERLYQAKREGRNRIVPPLGTDTPLPQSSPVR